MGPEGRQERHKRSLAPIAVPIGSTTSLVPCRFHTFGLMRSVSMIALWLRFRVTKRGPRAAKSDPRKPNRAPKGRQERHKRSPRPARSMVPMAPIQIGAIWVHDFSFVACRCRAPQDGCLVLVRLIRFVLSVPWVLGILGVVSCNELNGIFAY